VWYRWTAPTSGSTTIDTCTANIDSILAVYTGSALTGLSRVADNNNGCPSGWGSKVTFNATAGTNYRIAVGDAGGLRESTFTLKLVTADTTPPKVNSTSPANGATLIAPGANVTATFTEAMDASPTEVDGDPSTITGTTFKLMKAGTTTPIGALVSYNATTNKAKLDPNANLQLGTKYKAVVTTGAQDVAGNRLDQDQDPSNGLQQKAWTFTIRN
jgi:Bacterial Ig-like domain